MSSIDVVDVDALPVDVGSVGLLEALDERFSMQLRVRMLSMDVGTPSASIAPGLHGRVLVVLAQARDPLSGREVARRCGGSQRGVARILDELAADGLVHRVQAPPSALHQLSDQHLAAPLVRALAGLRGDLYQRLAAHASSWDPPALNVSVFGSYARGDGNRDSDIDLLVVTADDGGTTMWDARLADLEHAVSGWTGNPARLVAYTVADLLDAQQQGATIIQDLRRDAVTVTGTALAELLGSTPTR